ncbi:alpha/beta fold hydrolase [Pseudonocardia ailaonensis]|uniref:alpha/beta fold hydrolase n=1 Tax=Pseudonocardia ailaonensis TaxID=367279 RepID=UPI0031DA5483
MASRYFVPGAITDNGHGQFMTGQMYVEHLLAPERESASALVFLHGGALTGHCWMQTADGRPGWAPSAVDRGYDVVVVDQPDRGRSGWSISADADDFTRLSAGDVERLFTACAAHRAWSGAEGHTQWPGTGRVGDPVFDQFFAGTVPYLSDHALSQERARDAVAGLLTTIGPAVLVTHSQSGPQGWVAAGAAPQQVRAIIAIEPSGPPGREFFTGEPARGYGISDIPVGLDAEGMSVLRDIPILVVTGSASYHACYDDETVALMRSWGLRVEHVYLADVGIVGNGHMMQVESNSDQILELALTWLGTL